MHPTAKSNAERFFNIYVTAPQSKRLLEIGSQDVNGSLREVAPGGLDYVGVDFEAGKGVDFILSDPYSLPFDNDSFDIVVSSSCFEHSELFWLSFLEALRVLKPDGLLYINVPSNGVYHRFPLDCWRFYPDAGRALVTWANHSGVNAGLLESFVSLQQEDGWNDFVAVFVKDWSLADRHPRRIIEDFRDFENALLDGSREPILRSDVPQTMTKNNELIEKFDDLHGRLDRAEAALATTEAVLEQKSNELERLLKEKSVQSESFEGQKQALEAELARVGALLRESTAQIMSHTETERRLNKEIDDLRSACHHHVESIASLQWQYEAIKRSRAFKLVAPIRNIYHGFRDVERRLRHARHRRPKDERLEQRIAPPEANSDVGGAQSPSRQRERLRVVFISGDSASPSHVYRVENMARGLLAFGFDTEIVPLHELWRLDGRLADFDAAIFWRIAIGPSFGWSADVEGLVKGFREFGAAVFFDVDDLVFDPDLCTPEFVDGLRQLPPEERSRYDEGVRGYRDLMLSCGVAVVTTTELKKRAEKFGVRAIVARNGLDKFYEDALNWPVETIERENIVIGYTPGTRTHQKDFADAAVAIDKLLASRPHVHLRILGPLDLDEFPALKARLGQQVHLNDAVGRDRVFRFNQLIDINIVPLEMNNPFTSAKSELKYFEAAVFAVPTIATRVGPYIECIESGVNGFAVETDEEWFAALAALADDKLLRRKIGAAAREQAGERYRAAATAAPLAHEINAVVETECLYPPVLPQSTEHWPTNRDFAGSRSLTINWLVTEPIIGGGGHRMVLRAAYHLSRFGHRIRLYFTDTRMTVGQLRSRLHAHFFPFDCPIYVYDGSLKPADVTFATYWKTVETVQRHPEVAGQMFYFVQDFEPYFFPMGSDYILAEETYRKGFYAITAGDWCAHFIREHFKSDADSFRFPIQSLYKPLPRTKTRPNIVFFAKPEMPRRCYEIGLQVLENLHKARPDVELILFGSTHCYADTLPFPATLRGVLNQHELAELYSNADIGLVFSPTNPSAVPFEMMSCGLVVVDIDRPGSEANFGGRRDIVFLGSSAPEEMARQILDLLQDPEELQRRSDKGQEFVAQFPDELGMARRIEQLIVDRLDAVGETKSAQDVVEAAV